MVEAALALFIYPILRVEPAAFVQVKSARSAIPASRVASAPDASVVVNVVVEAYVHVSAYHTSRVSHPAHPEGVCHVAAVQLVAVSTCPDVGAVAALTSTVVVADFRAFVIPDVSPVAVPVQFVSVPEEGVPRTGVVRVGLVRVLLVRVSVVALPTSVSLESCRVYVLLAVFVLVKNEVNVLATLRSPNIPARNVFTPAENV